MRVFTGKHLDEARCRGAVWGNWHWYQCQRAGTLSEDGVLWCRQHAPSTIAKRQAKREAKYEAEKREWALKRAKAAIAEAALRYVETGDNTNLRAAVEKYHELESARPHGRQER